MLKIIALITMIVDHIGFFWDIDLFRLIGRLSFPIYCFLIAKGIKRSKDLKKYSIRILVCAIISQCVWMYIGVKTLNILFVYFLFIQYGYFIKTKNHAMSAIICVISVILSPVLEYGMYGFLLALMFFHVKDLKVQIICLLGLNIFFVSNGLLMPVQYFSVLSLFIISKYDKAKYYKKNSKVRGFFYAIYPLHLIVLFWIYRLIAII